MSLTREFFWETDLSGKSKKLGKKREHFKACDTCHRSLIVFVKECQHSCLVISLSMLSPRISFFKAVSNFLGNNVNLVPSSKLLLSLSTLRNKSTFLKSVSPTHLTEHDKTLKGKNDIDRL